MPKRKFLDKSKFWFYLGIINRSAKKKYYIHTHLGNSTRIILRVDTMFVECQEIFELILGYTSFVDLPYFLQTSKAIQVISLLSFIAHLF